jgi:hypothetical protein
VQNQEFNPLKSNEDKRFLHTTRKTEIESMQDLTAPSIDNKYLVGLSILPICTRYCFKMTNMIQVYSNFC